MGVKILLNSSLNKNSICVSACIKGGYSLVLALELNVENPVRFASKTNAYLASS
jgi:hypothetical protein